MAYVRSYGGGRPLAWINRNPPKEIIETISDTLSPKFGESLLGYLGRLAELNLTYVSSIRKAAGLDLSQIWYSDRDIHQLALYVRQDFGKLRQLAPTHPKRGEDGDVSTVFAGHKVNPEIVFHDSLRRVCPECLKSEATHRATWDLRIFQGCIRHNVRLASECPDCSRAKDKPVPLNWRIQDLRYCNCSFDLREISAEPYPEDHQLAQRLLEPLILGEPVSVPPLLKDMQPSLVFRAITEFSGLPLRVREVMLTGPDAGWRKRFGEFEGRLNFRINKVPSELGLRLSLGLTILSMPLDEFEVAIRRTVADFEREVVSALRYLKSDLIRLAPEGTILKSILDRTVRAPRAYE